MRVVALGSSGGGFIKYCEKEVNFAHCYLDELLGKYFVLFIYSMEISPRNVSFWIIQLDVQSVILCKLRKNEFVAIQQIVSNILNKMD